MVIIEDFRRLGKADAMLLLVLLSLLGIPFEYQHRASNSNLTSGSAVGRTLAETMVTLMARPQQPEVRRHFDESLANS